MKRDKFYLNALYRAALSCYMYSGLTMKYAKEFDEEHNLIAIFPYITAYQLDAYLKFGKILSDVDARNLDDLNPEKQKEISLSLAELDGASYEQDYEGEMDRRTAEHKTWKFFCDCYEDVDVELKEMYIERPIQVLYLILDYMTLPVGIFDTMDYQGYDAMENLQAEFFLNAVQQRSQYYFPHYQTAYLSFICGEHLSPLVLSAAFRNYYGIGPKYNEDILFLAYSMVHLMHDEEDIIKYKLNEMYLMCSASRRGEWCLHTMNLLTNSLNMDTLSQEEIHSYNTIKDFCQKHIFEAPAKNEEKEEDEARVYIDAGLSLDELDTMYDSLVNGGFLDGHSNKNDFLYYFGGYEESIACKKPLSIPTRKLIWKGEKRILAIFLGRLGVDNTWKIAGQIFDGVNVSSLKTACSVYKSQKDDGSDKFDEIIRQTEQKMKAILP